MSGVYVVMAGAYSDYHIVGVFDDKALAERCVAAIPDAGLETYPLNPMAEQLNAGLARWHVFMAQDGSAVEGYTFARKVEPNGDYKDCDGVDFKIYRMRPRGHQVYVSYFGSSQWASSEAHAIKIANERRAAALALGCFDGFSDDEYAGRSYRIEGGNFVRA